MKEVKLKTKSKNILKHGCRGTHTYTYAHINVILEPKSDMKNKGGQIPNPTLKRPMTPSKECSLRPGVLEIHSIPAKMPVLTNPSSK